MLNLTRPRPLKRLFALDILRERSGRSLRIWALPYIAPVINLDLCLYFGYLIHGRDAAHELPVFIVLAGIFFGVLFAACFMRDTAEVLRKTEILPLTPATRFLYAWLNTARRPALVLVYIVDAFFLASLTHDALKHVLLAQGLLLLLFADIQLALVAALIRPQRVPSRGLALLALALGFSFLELAAFAHIDQTLAFFPVLGWAALGINAGGGVLTVTCAYAGLAAFAALLAAIGLRRAS